MNGHIAEAKQAFKWTLYLRGLSQLVTWVISLVVIRFLTPADYAVVALTEIVFTLVLLLCSSGLGDALIQQKQAEESFNRKTLNLLICLTTLMSGLLFFAAPQLATFYQQQVLTDILRLSALVFLCTPWLVLASSLLARKMDFKSRGLIDLYSAICTAVLSLYLAWQGFGFWALILSNLLNILLRTIGYSWLIGRVYLPLVDFSQMWPALKFGLTVAATSLMFGLFMKVDILLAGLTLPTETLGFYALAMHLAILPMAKLMPLVNEVAFPMYARIRQHPEECQRIFAKVLSLVSMTAFPFFLLFAAVVEPAVVLLLGENWRIVAAPLQLILLTIPLRILSNLFSPLLKALGHPSTGLQHVTFSCGLVALMTWLVAPYGLLALAWGWLLITPMMLLFALWLLTSRSGISWGVLWQNVHKPLIFSLLTFLFLQYGTTWFGIPIPKPQVAQHWLMILEISAKGCLGLMCYFSLNWLFNRSQCQELIKFRF